MKLKLILSALFLTIFTISATGQSSPPFTHADTLRGSVTPQRGWWDVTFYDLHVAIHPKDSTITGRNAITYKVTKKAKQMQIDLQKPLQVDRIVQGGQNLIYRRDGDAFFVKMKANQPVGTTKKVTVYYSGRPHIAENPPWDGGISWERDKKGRPWIVTSDQSLGASVWWPNKDHQSEEPDSMGIHVTVPNPLTEVSNGRLRKITEHKNGTTTYSWFVSNPINNYGVALNAGYYTHINDTYQGEKGKLDLDYWVLDYDLNKAKDYFHREVHRMLEAYEYWFGPYPFYEDSYKLVQVSFLGMEHQSAVAYGNKFRASKRGRATGWGLKFDNMVVHESGHEWWGNSITAKDIADMWIHEGIDVYGQFLYVEYWYGKQAAEEYMLNTRSGIENEHPIIGHYGVNNEPTQDMYPKGANMLHTIRQIIGNEARWRQILRGLQQTFRHQTVTTGQIENYISRESGKDLSNVFDQYLRHADIPVFQYHISDGALYYRWKADVDGFAMSVEVTLGDGQQYTTITPEAGEWNSTSLSLSNVKDFKVDKNYYVNTAYVKPTHQL